MSVLKRCIQLAATAALVGTEVVVAAPGAAHASGTVGTVVFVVEDQAGGAFYNVKSGERSDVVVASAVPTLGILAVQVADGLVLTTDGQLFAPLVDKTAGTPADTVVTVAQTTTNATLVDTSTQATYALVTERSAVPAANEFALQLATGGIVTAANKVLIPIEVATHTTR